MKCTAIKLRCREENHKRKISTPVFAGEEGRSYSVPFRRPATKLINTTLAITNIDLPDDIQGFNTGASLDRWSKKRAKLKSAKISKTPTEFDKEFCYESLETDFSLLLNGSEDRASPVDSLKNLQYEVHTDIEKLIQETERSAQDNDSDKKKRKKRGKEKKKIRFSKSPSPQTEQVIRVDVTSNASANEVRADATKMEEENDNPKTIDDKKKELKLNLINLSQNADDDIIIKCRQLALRQRRRRLR